MATSRRFEQITDKEINKIKIKSHPFQFGSRPGLHNRCGTIPNIFHTGPFRTYFTLDPVDTFNGNFVNDALRC